MKIKVFVFNPFQVNTYLVYNESGECVIIDAACYDKKEEMVLLDYITANSLTPKALLNTHGHVDHICGNYFIKSILELPIYIHKEDLYLVDSAQQYGQLFGFMIDKPPAPTNFLEEGDVINIGDSTLDVLHAPGHSPGSLLFYSQKDQFLIAGDVIFSGSIGRTDLSKGDYLTLINSIRTKILVLPPHTKIFPGHGDSTTIENEMEVNPFLQ